MISKRTDLDMSVAIYTYRRGFRKEFLDVMSRGVDDAEPCDVDGTVLDHLTLPALVHYLIRSSRWPPP